MSRKAKSNNVFCEDRLGKKVKVKFADLTFRPSIYAIAIKNDKVLLVPQWDGWDFPGGGVDLGESLDEAFERELWEETGLKAKRGKDVFVGSKLFISPNSGKPLHTILIYSLAKSLRGKISTNNFDENEKIYAKKAEWIDLKRTSKLKFYNGVDSVKLIKSVINGKQRN